MVNFHWFPKTPFDLNWPFNKISGTIINVKYLGKYIKWESGQVKAMHFYLRYINHLGSLQKKSAHRHLQAGFTITEVLLAGVLMLIAVLVSGIGVINLLRSNYRANADSEIRNNLNIVVLNHFQDFLWRFGHGKLL